MRTLENEMEPLPTALDSVRSELVQLREQLLRSPHVSGESVSDLPEGVAAIEQALLAGSSSGDVTAELRLPAEASIREGD